MQDFLPINKKDMQKRGWDCVDFVYVTGDAYIDHPSFGSAIISTENGFTVILHSPQVLSRIMV